VAQEAAEVTQFADFHQAYVSGYIQLADAKAGAVFTVAGGVLGYLLSQAGFRENLLSSAPNYLATATLAALCATFALAFAVIRPRGLNGTGPVFFGSVAQYERDQYLALIESLSAEQLARERLAHCHALSIVCRKKYSYLRVSIWAGLAGLLLAGASIARFGL
jgi:hypothetical protein